MNLSFTRTASPFFGLLGVVTSGNVDRKETYFLHNEVGNRDEIVRIWSGRSGVRARSSTAGRGTRAGQLGGFSSGCFVAVTDLAVDDVISFVFDFDLGGMFRIVNRFDTPRDDRLRLTGRDPVRSCSGCKTLNAPLTLLLKWTFAVCVSVREFLQVKSSRCQGTWLRGEVGSKRHCGKSRSSPCINKKDS